jgi:O-succinylbenzoic acid--CoA ligase
VARALGEGWPLALTYGMTEMTSQVATAPPERVRAKPGTVGAPLDGAEVRVAPDGEILTRGATLALGYVGAEAPLRDPDGWYHTGDLGRVDHDGDLWVTGRRSDRIVSGGVNVDAHEVEAALREHPAVGDACVVGVPDDRWGEAVAAALVPRGGPVDLDGLADWLRGRLSPAKRPRRWRVVEALPLNANGKVDRGAVRREMQQGAMAAAPPPPRPYPTAMATPTRNTVMLASARFG